MYKLFLGLVYTVNLSGLFRSVRIKYSVYILRVSVYQTILTSLADAQVDFRPLPAGT